MKFNSGKFKPYRDILHLVWPLALGMINNAVMQFVDRAYLARYSMEALDAVLPAGVLAWIFMGLIQSIVGYSGVFVAQYHGAGERELCRTSYRAAAAIALAAGVLILPFVPLGNLIIDFSAPNEEIAALERTYYCIVMLGSFFIYGQMAAASFFTGRGLTRMVFWVNLGGNLLNIALDPILIFGWLGCPELGIAGAAYATVFSMAVQYLVLAVAARRDTRPSPLQGVRAICRNAEFRQTVVKILRFGIPAGLYESLNMASFTIFVFVTGGVGTVELAASNACFTINYLLFAPTMGFAIGAQTLVGQARGRGDDAEAFAVLRRTLKLALSFIACTGILTLIFHRPLLWLFAPDNLASAAEFHRLGGVLLMFMAAWMLFDAADIVYAGALKGAGDSRFVMWWMLLCAFVFWLPLVFLVRSIHNTMPALWGTMVFYVILICIGSARRWHRGSWKKITLIEGA